MNQKNSLLVAITVVILASMAVLYILKDVPAPAAVPVSINPSPQQPVVVPDTKPIEPTTPSWVGNQLLSVGFPLQPDHLLYMKFDGSIVPMGKLFYVKGSNGSLTQIKNVSELSRITGQISTREQVLAFVSFFTSEPTKFLLEQNPVQGIEPAYSVSEMPQSLTRLLTTTTVELHNGQWVIERDLLRYPSLSAQEQRVPAQLVRSYETLSQDGIYTFSIGRVLAEGDEVNSFLPYYD